MKRTTAAGNDNNRYTEGNPSLGIAATVVGAEELNNIQEEIANAIEAAGLTVDQTGNTEDQLASALNILIQQGGSQQVEFTLANNQSAAANITNLTFDSANYVSAQVDYFIQRKDDAEIRLQSGKLILLYDVDAADWRLIEESNGDDSQARFTVNTTAGVGQIQYTTDNMTGGNYTGSIKYVTKRVFNA